MKFLFYKPIRINSDENCVCFWSDTHFGHRCENWDIPLWKTRGFQSIEEHDTVLIQRWNKKSSSNTTFFHLGDFMFGSSAADRFKEIIYNLNFKELYILPGNHQSGWKQCFEKQKTNIWTISSNKRVIFVPNYIEASINNQPIVMSHYPLASYNGQSRGSWMLHGHCHKNLYNSEIGPMLYKTKMIDLGIENFAEPLTFNELNVMLKDRSSITYDSHINTK